MLSNPPHMSGLHSRQRQHRRQNSTPSAFDVVKIAPLPSPQKRRPTSHRRGLSLDTRGEHLPPAPTTTRQEYVSVSMPPPNTGPPSTPRHELRDTQQQHTARPSHVQHTSIAQDISEGFIHSPQVTPQSRRFANGEASHDHQADLHDLPFDPFSASLSLCDRSVFDRSVNRLNENGIDVSVDMEFYGRENTISTPSFMTFPDSSPADTCPGWVSETDTASSHSQRSSRRISNGIMDKVAKFEVLGSELNPSRPCTPIHQTTNDRFPQTPVGTVIKQEPASVLPPNRFSEGYDESMEETLKPVRNNRTDNRTSGTFQDLRRQAEAMVHTPPRANTIPMALTNQGLRTPEFMNMRTISAEFRKLEREFSSIPTSPVEIPAIYLSTKSNPVFPNKPELQPLDRDFKTVPGSPSLSSRTASRRSSPHRRTESIASLTSAASIADINIEETKTETGVTLEDIAAFIQGPDPSDGKWRCLYEGCNKPFGRKENIKSHVQTHLNDRQYQCPTCKKCFVRQHDLKRHAKIHTGIKPYPCECGNSFARHDALTRHRQRGMCIGAFDGIVRKVVKRGRPKKIRPDMDERRDKAERTRRKNKVSSANSTSSQSGYSDVSAANSPYNDFDGLLDDDQFANILSAIPNPTSSTMNPTSLAVSTAAMPATIPGSMAEVLSALSPSTISTYSHASTSEPQAMTTSMTTPDPLTLPAPRSPSATVTEYNSPPSPTKSVASQYTQTTTTHLPGSPPDLSSPQSPPPLLTSSSDGDADPDAQFFDLDQLDRNNSSVLSDASIGLGTTVAAHAAAAAAGGVGGIPGIDAGDSAEMLLGFHMGAASVCGGDGEGFVLADAGHHGLHCHAHLGQGGVMKFEDDFDPVSMFTGGEDVFFGTA
ncbi:hypothetical protein N657DRAFT_665248 [Parathielavia appendiculata]|uniref:C2H2 type master regulator of conidiophore development brlA n=1 Tax=Parathielavia appendiculata TaxID=2587402 RepID=A0AAN6Z226_9PEZI|nr:hypothetical protein N657DRAFT_665248 [Parathielavia appendiculata]